MLFNSISFLCFFPVVVGIYFLVPKTARYLWLLFASYYFYMSQNPGFALLLLLTTVITYASGLMLSALSQESKPKADCLKKWVVFGSVFANLGILFMCKYIPFHLFVPVGISFYTFQALSYTIDVYRRKAEAEKNFFRYALYVSFFPTILSGPIQRAADFLPQLKALAQKKLWDEKRIANGLFFMLWGYFLKLVLADRIAVFVNAAYAGYESLGSGVLALAAVLYAFQIYCDFAGYSCIAIGAGTVMGFTLMRNFDAPYLAGSVKEFWRRWHISLSSFLRDYLYIPLGGSRCSRLCKYRNIMIIFLVSGMWHGVGLHYLVWGGLNGFFQVCEDAFSAVRRRLPCKRLLTFIVASFTWVFFRAESVSRAVHVCLGVCRISGSHVRQLLEMGLGRTDVLVLAIAIAVLIVADLLHEKGSSFTAWLLQRKIGVRYAVYLAVCMVLLLQVVADFGQPAASFLYFQF